MEWSSGDGQAFVTTHEIPLYSLHERIGLSCLSTVTYALHFWYILVFLLGLISVMMHGWSHDPLLEENRFSSSNHLPSYHDTACIVFTSPAPCPPSMRILDGFFDGH
jgi:hypothetical protein